MFTTSSQFRRVALVLTVLTGLPSFASAQGADEESKTQIVILFDVSQSMKGFTADAREAVLEFVSSHDNGDTLELGLYTYGSANGATSPVATLTTDTETVEAELAELSDDNTSGGREPCGAAIDRAIEDHEELWSENTADTRIIIVVGNEHFDQGSPDAKSVIQRERQRLGEIAIDVHTIFCGRKAEGIRDEWQEGANVGKGTFQSLLP